MDVPLDGPYAVSEPAFEDINCRPGATKSGLMRPSSVGPQLENVVITTSSGVEISHGALSTAPTVSTFFDTPESPMVSYPVRAPSRERTAELIFHPSSNTQWGAPSVGPCHSRSLPALLMMRYSGAAIASSSQRAACSSYHPKRKSSDGEIEGSPIHPHKPSP